MTDDIKSLLDSIIDDTNNSYKGKEELLSSDDNGGNQIHRNHCHCHPVTFDSGKFREKLSLFVLKDLICAMMHDDTRDLDCMIDESIMRHIHNNYKGSCYGYLCNARDRLKSPLIGDIVQEIDDKTNEVSNELSETKDESLLNNEINTKNLLKNVENFDEFRDKIKDIVSHKVVDDVAGVISQRNDAPVFDGIDDELKKVNNSDTTEESVILKMCGSIVTESAINNERISTEEGIERAIVEYCIAEMDYLFKADPKVSIYAKYKI